MDKTARRLPPQLPPQLLEGLPPLNEAQRAHLLEQIDRLVESRRADERQAGERVFSVLWKQVAQANFEYRFMDLMDAAVLRIVAVLLVFVALYLWAAGALLSTFAPEASSTVRSLAWLGLFVSAPSLLAYQIVRLYRQAGEVRRV